MKKPLKMWGGFTGGRLFVNWCVDDFGGPDGEHAPIPAIFRTKKEARKRFQDVRKIIITEDPTP